MPSAQGVVLRVSFGPAAAPLLPHAVALAREHADEVEQVGERTWRVTFRLAK